MEALMGENDDKTVIENLRRVAHRAGSNPIDGALLDEASILYAADTITRLTRERDDLRVDAEVLSDRYAEVRALADAYIDLVNRTARALGIPEVDEDGATPSLHDVPERVAEVVRERDKYLGGLVAIAAACAVSDESVAWNTMLRCDDIASMLLPKREEPTDDDATQDGPRFGQCPCGNGVDEPGWDRLCSRCQEEEDHDPDSDYWLPETEDDDATQDPPGWGGGEVSDG